MEIRSLEGTSLPVITTAFNSAFDNYFVPLQLSEEQMATKMRSERISLAHSIGVFENNELAGFILHGIDTINGLPTAYNAATGVVPEHRGNRLTENMYTYAVQQLSQQNIFNHVLEVITENERAKRVYEKVGFTTVRTLGCYSGSVNAYDNDNITIANGSWNDILPLTSSFNFAPTWQQSIASLEAIKEQHEVYIVKQDDEEAGYAIFLPTNGRIRQFVVVPQFRRKGIGKALFSYLSQATINKQLTVISVDESDLPTVSFIENIGMKRFLGLYEMTCTFTS
jgi:ribosomal protein S18 acetylase RimI-like enzyme